MEKSKYYTPDITEFCVGFEYYLYRHVTKDNNMPFYIGIGKKHKYSNTIESEYKRAFSKNRSDYWYNIVNKHDYIVEILFESSSKEKIIEKEKEFIKLYGRRDLNTGTLCNLTDGGEWCSNLSKEVEKERRLKISKALVKRIRKQSTFDKISKSKLKSVHKCDINFNILEEFNSITEAAKSINLTLSSISKCLKNEKYTAGGYKWKYKSI
jgi:hypothetical protein